MLKEVPPTASAVGTIRICQLAATKMVEWSSNVTAGECVVPKALFLCVEELSGQRYTHARDRWVVRPDTAEESGLLELTPGATVIHLVHTACDENGAILEVSESVWPADRIIILDDYEIAQEPEDLRGLSDI